MELKKLGFISKYKQEVFLERKALFGHNGGHWGNWGHMAVSTFDALAYFGTLKVAGMPEEQAKVQANT